MTNERDVAAIAAGLSAAMKRAVLWFPANGARRSWFCWLIEKPSQRSILALIDRGIVEGVTGLQGFVRGCLTPLGLAVRKYLEEHP